MSRGCQEEPFQFGLAIEKSMISERFGLSRSENGSLVLIITMGFDLFRCWLGIVARWNGRHCAVEGRGWRVEVMLCLFFVRLDGEMRFLQIHGDHAGVHQGLCDQDQAEDGDHGGTQHGQYPHDPALSGAEPFGQADCLHQEDPDGDEHDGETEAEGDDEGEAEGDPVHGHGREENNQGAGAGHDPSCYAQCDEGLPACTALSFRWSVMVVSVVFMAVGMMVVNSG